MSLNTSIINNTGVSLIALSDGVSSPVAYLKMESGRILDNNNKFVYSYNPNETYNIELVCGQSKYDLRINENILALGQPKSTGIINYVSINDQGNQLDSPHVSVYGDSIAQYGISGKDFNTLSPFITGGIFNSGQLPFVVYSWDYSTNSLINSISGVTGSVAPSSSASFYLGYVPFSSGFDYNYTVIAETNFGQVTKTLTNRKLD